MTHLVGEELAVTETEVREAGHATEYVHETVGRQFGGGEIQFVYSRSLPLDGFHVCIFQRCTTTSSTELIKCGPVWFISLLDHGYM